ncbi:MAG: sigma-70 family RNA polymerase sigma factor [Deltaproteobacteria bacterium]|nr:sigma-70 family RNA polymerase sigma factor [Deltaproteobacteria bacterium]
MDTADLALLTPHEASSEPSEAGIDEPEVTYLQPSDRRLIARIRQGDERAFSELVSAYQDRIFSLSLRMMGSREEAEDLTQEVFVALYQHLGQFRGEAQLSTWIFRVTRNRCLNRLKYLGRRSAGKVTPLDSVPARNLAESSGRSPTQPDQHLEGLQLQETVEAALLELGEEQRMMVLLRDVEGLAYEEIAEICERPVGTVKSRLHRARLALAEAVSRSHQTRPPAAAGGAKEEETP